MSSKDVVWKGPVIGINSQGYPTPVFYDPHTSISAGGAAGASSSNGVLITGSPGSGKSFTGMNFAAISTICGKRTIFLDPKNDSLGLMNLADQFDNKVTLWDINDPDLAGSMDPFISQKDMTSKVSKAYALIEILLGPFTEEQETTLYPIVQDVASSKDGSMTKLQLKLARHANRGLNALGTRLDAIQGSSPISKLIFGVIDDDEHLKENVHSMKVKDGLTIISTLGMQLPERTADPKNYQPKEKLGLGIMYLICDFIADVMKDPKHKTEPKTVFIDEAWAITSSPEGYNTAMSLLRLGRAFNLAVVLMSQNVSDLERGDGKNELTNSIVTRFAFRCNEDAEAAVLCQSMGLPPTKENIGYFTNLNQGDCIMRDYKKRISQIHIITQSPEWSRAFETNPDKKQRILQEERERKQQEAIMHGDEAESE